VSDEVQSIIYKENEFGEGHFNFFANSVSSLSRLRGLKDIIVHLRRGFETKKDLERTLEKLIMGPDYESSQVGKPVQMLGGMRDVELRH
jgi:hypothetical protein